MEEVLKTVGANIALQRKAQGLSQEDLAAKAGVPRSTIAGLEVGNGNPTLKNLLLISAALQISIQEITTPPRSRAVFIPKKEIPAVKKAKGQILVRKMLPDPIPGMEIDYVTLDSNTRLKGVPHMKGSKEYMICTKGSVEVFVEGVDVIGHQLDVAEPVSVFGESAILGESFRFAVP